MLALWRDWTGELSPDAPRLANSLGLFAGYPAPSYLSETTACAVLPSPRLSRRPGTWKPPQTEDGTIVLFNGRFDNLDEITAELGARESPALLYAEAVRRWGDKADNRCVGHYCAIISDSEKNQIRLSRTPWSAPPLHYFNDAGQMVAASVPRVIHAAGFATSLNRRKLADNLFLNLLEDEEGWYEGMARVPLGTVVHLEPGRRRLVRYYDPRQIPAVRLSSDEDYVEAASALIAESVSKALAACERPGMSLSGGLDSPVVTAEVLRQLPTGRRLPCFTFVPVAEWDGVLTPDLMGDERPFVEAFAQMHPQLDLHFTDNAEGGFDHRWNELFLAMGVAPNFLCNYYVYQGVWHAAHTAGCDVLLNAGYGNQTFSNDGRWGYVEYLLTGRWGQLVRALRHRPGDPRALFRKLLSLSLLPLLPQPLRAAVLRCRHPSWASMNEMAGMAAPAAKAHYDLAARAKANGAMFEWRYPRSRIEATLSDWKYADMDSDDVQQGFEQVYGLRQHDITRYRPLIEFCMGLPTHQFLRDGIDRWLGRRLADGQMPEAQRSNPRYGRHNVDWHARLTPRRAALIQEARRQSANPRVAELVDLPRLIACLEDWPERTTYDPAEWVPRAAGVPRGLLTARFVDFVEGRNDV